jgi:hypothetical protein
MTTLVGQRPTTTVLNALTAVLPSDAGAQEEPHLTLVHRLGDPSKRASLVWSSRVPKLIHPAAARPHSP